MKKTLYLAAIAAMSLFVVACSSDDNDGKEPTPDPDPIPVKVRVATFAEVGGNWKDLYKYTFGTDGKVTKITRDDGAGVINKNYAFAYAGSTLTITESTNPFVVITLGSNGLASSMTRDGETFDYTYDAKGHMTKITTGTPAEDVSVIKITDESIATWTRFSSDVWQTKVQTYQTVENTAGIFNIHAEKGGLSRWLMETGLFGTPVKYLCATSKWQHSEVGATYVYVRDANGCVTKETKTYGTDDEIWEYTWTVIK